MTSPPGNDNQAFRLEEKKPGTHQESLVGPEDRIIRYTLHVPEHYDGSRPVPLIVTLHFGGRVTPYFGRTILTGLVEPALRELGAIIVSPDSLNGPWSTPENEAAVVMLFETLCNSYNIDRDQTLLTGYSLGGHGTWVIGGKHQDLFKALVPIAGRPTDQTDWQIPIHVIHSRQDSVVPFAPAQQQVERLQAAGVDISFKVVEDLSHYETPYYRKYLKQAVPWIRQAWKN